MVGVQNIAKSMGWQLLASTPHLGIGNVEPLGNASSSILASPLGDRLVLLFCFRKHYNILIHVIIKLNHINVLQTDCNTMRTPGKSAR